MKSSNIVNGALLVVAVRAQQSAYGQCGGSNWSGATSCVSGYSCSVLNSYYSQCLPGAKAVTSTIPSSSSSSAQLTGFVTSTTSATTPSATGFKWLGVDESGAEFGNTAIPGIYGKDFIFPATSSLSTLMSQGFNSFRVPFLMERMAPGTITSPLSPAYLANYTATINYITSNGGWAIVDPHNYGRYNNAIITDTNSFQTFWINLASTFKSNPKVIFDTNNEYNTMDQTLVLNLNQAAINGIRASGATSQYIFVEGNQWTGAWDWRSVNDNMKALTDPENKLIYEMHQYLDSDDSGTSATCVNSTIGVDRVTDATNWLRENGKIGIIGEMAGGANAVCMSAVKGMLEYLKANSDVWTGAIWWGGGPWWGDYIYGFEPPSSTGYNYYDSLLKNYAPSAGA